jgi:hypothetical protein
MKLRRTESGIDKHAALFIFSLDKAIWRRMVVACSKVTVAVQSNVGGDPNGKVWPILAQKINVEW